MHVLHVIDSLEDGGARLVGLLAPVLAARGCAVEVCCLGAGGRRAEALRQAGVSVHVLGWTRWLDATALFRLRGMLRGGGSGLIQVWSLSALRAVALVAPEALSSVVLSAPLPAAERLAWWDRRLLRRVRCVTRDADGGQWTKEGLACRELPAVAAPDPAGVGGAEWVGRYPRRVVCTGLLRRERGFREAVWAIDILRYVVPDVHLLIIGSGPFEADLRSMIDRLSIDNAHLLGEEVEVAEVLAAADVCWVPSRADVGRQEALEAMALGRPVVACDVPGLRGLIRDGETGCLVAPGNPVALARRTRALLLDPAGCERMGRAARADALGRFAPGQVAARWYGLYNDLAA
jgi:hypothetical protein